ncbi:MAG TPA: hypothetical protein VER17_05185 [Tepidisphaeraceae bacterium]|nr:hypothetical protein [Tepidisphaeraceae bacterium]
MIQPLERRALFAAPGIDPNFERFTVLPQDDLPDGSAGGPVPGLIQPLAEGKFLTAGLVMASTDNPAFRVARFNEDGTLDATFNSDGRSPVITVPGAGSDVRGVVQSDGKVVLATATAEGVAVGRFNADGSIDTTFGGGDGLATAGGLDINQPNLLDANPRVAVTTGGQIVVLRGATRHTTLFVTRFEYDGDLDPSFSGDGLLAIRQPDVLPTNETGSEISAVDVAPVAGNKVLLLAQLGDYTQEGHRPALIQLAGDGSFDTTFGGGDGKLPFFFRPGSAGSDPGAMLVQDDGKIVVGGYQAGDGGDNGDGAALARFNANGTLDTSFGTGGVGIALTPRAVAIRDLAIDRDGRFVVLNGDSGSLVRWTAGGDPDATFGAGGYAEADLSAPVFAIDQDNRITGHYAGQLTRYFSSPQDRPDVELGSLGVLLITGEAGAADNTITVTRSGANLVVTRNGASTTFAAADVKGLDVHTFDGDDTITTPLGGVFVLGNGNNALTVGDSLMKVTAGDGNDTLTSGNGQVELIAGGGDDLITVGDGPVAQLLGGDGDDTITTGNGDDEVYGQAGADVIRTGGGNDTLWGGVAHDFAGGFIDPAGGEADGGNLLEGGDGNDVLIGAAGRDTIRGGAQRDLLVGFAGSDLLSGGGGKDKIAGLGGNDRIYGGAGDDQLSGGTYHDRIFGGGGDDKISGDPGRDTLDGGAGDDRFFAEDGEIDSIDGGAGDNVAAASDEEDDILKATRAA